MHGLGLDLLDTEIIVTESSSGEHKENAKRTEDDILKQTHNYTTILKSGINKYRNAVFSTIYQVDSFGIHCVKKEITLGKIKLNIATCDYIYQEIRYAEIPVTCKAQQE
ncbi:unnamed protein product [Rhizopus stolonifer]